MDDAVYSVYKHTTPNGKVYIGITGRSPKERWDSGHGYKGSSAFYNAIKKYGWDSILHEILYENLTKDEAESFEVELISLYQSNERKYGYNIALGGSANQLGRKRTETERERISLTCKTSKVFLEGSKRGAVTRIGHVTAEDTKRKISLANAGKITNINRLKPVISISDCAIYPSVASAARENNMSDSRIYRCCSGETKSANGKRWAFINTDYLSDEVISWIYSMTGGKRCAV